MLARLRGVKREAAVRIKDVVMMKMIRSQLRITLGSLSAIYYLQCLLESGRGGSKLLM